MAASLAAAVYSAACCLLLLLLPAAHPAAFFLVHPKASAAVLTSSSVAMVAKMTRTQKYTVPMAGMKAVKASAVEVDLPEIKNKNK